MLRIAGFFVAGVLLGIYQPDFIPLNFVVCLVVALAILFFILRYLSTGNRLALLSGLVGLFVIFFFGYSRLIFFMDSRNKNHISEIKEPIEVYEAIVRSVPEEKAKSWKIEIEITKIKCVDWKRCTGRLLLYVSKKNNPTITWHYGDKILVKGNPHELNPPANPGEFDFKRFLSFKNISHQQFASVDEVKFISESSSKDLIYYSHQTRAWCMKKINA